MTEAINTVALALCDWDMLYAVLRRKYPHIGKYGAESSGDGTKLQAALKNDQLMRDVAEAIFEAQCAYNGRTAGARETIKQADAVFADRLKEIMGMLPE